MYIQEMKRSTFLKRGLCGLAAWAVLGTRAQKMSSEPALTQVGFEHFPENQTTEVMQATFKQVLHRADTRGKADHGWLKSRHTFSFAQYYNPERMHFGALRVLNDDVVAGSMGFGTHPHDNMEIVSIPLSGDLVHKDSAGNEAIIREGDVQIMSAGTGIRHSEKNYNRDKTVKFLQIWVFPKAQNIAPRYAQQQYPIEARRNTLKTVVSPTDEGALWINQDAYFTLGRLDKDVQKDYTLRHPDTHGVYAFVIKGRFDVAGQVLAARDGLGLWELTQVAIQALDADSELLLIEVPMRS